MSLAAFQGNSAQASLTSAMSQGQSLGRR